MGVLEGGIYKDAGSLVGVLARWYGWSMKPYLHARQSTLKFGGTEDDYLAIHDFI